MAKRTAPQCGRKNGAELTDIRFFFGNVPGRARTNEDVSWFLDRTIECGPATKKFLSAALQVPLPSVSTVRWNRDYFLVRLSLPGIRQCILKKYRPSEKKRYAAVGAHRVINDMVLLVPGIFSGAAVRTFLGNAEKKLSCIQPARLFSVLRSDSHERVSASVPFGVPGPGTSARPEMGPAGPRQGQGEDRIARTEFPYYEWGNEHVQNLFMFTPMIRSRVPFSGIRTERMREIVHGDNECVYMSDRPDPFHFIGMVDMGALQESAMLHDPRSRRSGPGVQDVVNNYAGAPVSILYDEDVIQGATLRLKELLRALARTGTSSDVLINCTCTPLIIGDDVRSLIKNVNTEQRTSFLYCDAVKQNANDIYLGYAKELMSGLTRYPVVPGTIALVGFPQVSGMAELLDVLAECGVSVMSAVLPQIGPLICSEYLKAQLQVFFPNADNMRIYEQVFYPLERPRVMPDAPYGFKRAKAWVDEILQQLSLAPDTCAPLQRYLSEKESAWREEVRNARHYRLGMVVAPEDVARLCDPAQSVAGMPLIPFLEEMGFALDVCIYCPRERYAELRTMLASLFSDAGPHRIDHCFGPGSVRKWLSGTGAVCIYSDLLLDHRLSLAGKTRFSMADLEMGFDGALRTVRRLLRKCAVPFYVRYRDKFKGMPRPVEFKER